MALIVKDRVKESTTSTGTGTITLEGSPTGFRTFADIGNGNTTYYCISGGSQFEVGVGTYTASGTTLSRDTVLSNSLGTTAKIDFSAGSKDVFCDLPAEKVLAPSGTSSQLLANDGSGGLSNVTIGSNLTYSAGTLSATGGGGMTYPGAGIPKSTGSAWGTSYSTTGTGNVVLSTSPSFGANTGFGVTPITWTGTYNSLQVGYGGAISNITAAASLSSEMSISSNLKNIATSYLYVNNGYATRYYQVDGVHHWAVDSLSGGGIANNPATMQDVMTLDSFGVLNVTGSITGTSASFGNLDGFPSDLSISTSSLGNTTIGSAGAGFTTTFNDDTVRINGTMLLVGSATVNQNIATNQTTGTLAIGGASATGTITLGRSTGAQTVNIATGVTAASTTKAVNIGTAGNATSTTNIAIGSATGTSTTTHNGINNYPALTASQAVFTDASKNLVSVATTGTGSVVLSTRPTMSVTGAGLTLQDDTDNTKQANFLLSGITTGTTRTYTLPNVTSTLAALGLAQTWSATQTYTNGIIVSSNVVNITGPGAGINVTGQTTGTSTIGGTAQTGTLTFGQPTTASQTINIANAVLATGNTQTINIGASAATGSTTNIAIGSASGTSTTTLNGKTSGRIVPRVTTTTSSATPTINTDNTDQYGLTAQAVDITSFTTNLSGTPTDGQKLWIYIVGTAARAITWGASFEASTVALPTTTVTTNRLDIGFVWNAATTKWRCVAVA